MLYESKAITLKDGSECLFRSPIEGDGSEMSKYLQTCAGETEFILLYPEECASIDAEYEEKYLRDINESKNRVMIVAVVDGHIAGNCQLVFNTLMKTKHRGSIAIAVMSKYWGKGIGTAMIGEMSRLAREAGLRHLQLEYIEGNERARALYEKTGFKAVGELPGAFMLRDGRLVKEIFMTKML